MANPFHSERQTDASAANNQNAHQMSIDAGLRKGKAVSGSWLSSDRLQSREEKRPEFRRKQIELGAAEGISRAEAGAQETVGHGEVAF